MLCTNPFHHFRLAAIPPLSLLFEDVTPQIQFENQDGGVETLSRLFRNSARLDEGVLTGQDGAVGDSGGVGAGKEAPDGVVDVQPGDELLGTGGVAPVAHEVADNGEQADNLDTGVGHAVVGDVADESRVGARGLGVGPDGVALLTQGQSQEGGADVGGDTGHDDLGSVVRADGLAELLVVPGVDLTLALDKGHVGVHLKDLTSQRTVGACGSMLVFYAGTNSHGALAQLRLDAGVKVVLHTLVGRGGHDDGEIKDLAESGVAKSLVPVKGRVEVTGDLVETLLDINNEQDLDHC